MQDMIAAQAMLKKCVNSDDVLPEWPTFATLHR